MVWCPQGLRVPSLVASCRIFGMLVYLEMLALYSSLSLVERVKVRLASHRRFDWEPFLENHESLLLPQRPPMHRVCLR